MGFLFQFIYMVDHIDRFSYVKPSLQPRDEACLVMVDDFSDSWVQFASILLRIFASMFIRDIGLLFFS